ncbi:MAG: DUF2214 family protein [Burkholderiaceae bacterium]
MIVDAVMSMLHWWLVIALIAALVSEMNLCRGQIDAALARRLARIDMIYGISAVLLLIVGFGRALHGPKGWAFYGGNPVFWIKIALFLAIALASIGPTIQFARWNKRLRAGGTVAAEQVMGVRRWIHREMLLLIAIPVAAALMARGIGL